MDDRTTINVKSVDAEAWALARKHAAQRGLPMGEWLSAAIRTQAAVEQGDQIMPPSGPSLEAMEAALGALAPILATLGPVPSARYLADCYARRVAGLPPPAPGRLIGKAGPESGQSWGNPRLVEHEKTAAPDARETAAKVIQPKESPGRILRLHPPESATDP